MLLNAAPRTVKKPVEVGGRTYVPRVHLLASAWLVQHDAVYPNPYAFQPERFLESDPGTYTRIPFRGWSSALRRPRSPSWKWRSYCANCSAPPRSGPVSTGPKTRRRAITVTPAAAPKRSSPAANRPPVRASSEQRPGDPPQAPAWPSVARSRSGAD